MNDPASPPASVAPSRRQFLLAASGTAAGALLLGGDLFSAPSGLQLLADSTGLRVPVAYVEGSSGATSLAAALSGASRRALPAAGLRAAESLVGRPARLTVQGFASGRHGQRDFGQATVLLDAHVPSPANHGQTIPFYAFTFRRDPVVSQSTPSRLHLVRGLALRVGFRLVATQGASATTVFTSRPQRALPTLQPGVYLLGLQQGMWAGATKLPAVDDAAWAALPSLVVVVEAEVAQ